MTNPMLSNYVQMIGNQYEASLCMLQKCIEKCPVDHWHEKVVELRFCQAVFHALFFTDAYLGWDFASMKGQVFHAEHAAIFADYEELLPKRQTAQYEKPFVEAYLQHCRQKVTEVLPTETEESLARPGFEGRNILRAEWHIYNIRHIHHHAAQLSLYLRKATGEGVEWVGSGWRD
jgi:hypothetical protein